MAQKKTLSTRVPEAWFAEIDDLIAHKFPYRNRSEWLLRVVEHELEHQKDRQGVDARLNQLLANDERMLALLREIHGAVVKGTQGVRDHASD